MSRDFKRGYRLNDCCKLSITIWVREWVVQNNSVVYSDVLEGAAIFVAVNLVYLLQHIHTFSNLRRGGYRRGRGGYRRGGRGRG